MELIALPILLVLAVLVILAVQSIRVVNEYQRATRMTGQYMTILVRCMN
jgi:regulator of protease activity HflC (stomatin/prohibitin superfamily)